jgi:flavorubredoxin
MDTTTTEIADGIYRFSTWVPDIGPTGFTFNQFLVDADEPLLFHTGPRGMFASVSAALSAVVPVDRLRWITFGHLEADECGAMNHFLGAAPGAAVAHTVIGCLTSVNDLADRPPVPLGADQVLDLGGKRVRSIDTPHVPHGWDAHVLYEETTGTLLCGDLLSNVGNGPAVIGGDILGPAVEAEDMFAATALTPTTGATIRHLASLQPATLAVMHGSSFAGDGAAVLTGLADDCDRRLRQAAG